MNYENNAFPLALEPSHSNSQGANQDMGISKPYLLFESRGALWGVAAEMVCEVLLLPEIAPLDGALWWVGVLDVRGRIIPILELGELSSAQPRCFQTTDSVVIVDSPQGQLGLIVEAVRDVRFLPEGENEGTSVATVQALTRADGEIVRLLNLAFVARFAAHETVPPEATSARSFCPEASSEERALFLQRARALLADTSSEGEDAIAPTLVAVCIGGETFGLEMEWVREFAQRPHVTPVPGASPDLLGLVNLRGEVVPLLDLRPALGLPPKDGMGEQITFVECGGLHVGIAVDDVLNVFAPREGDLLPPPTASHCSGDGVRAAIFYEGATLAVLDLPAVLQQAGWAMSEMAVL